ncbi:TlpA family protein disulfide reductase [Hymenobacter arcticus]
MALPASAQQAGGFTLSGQDARLADQTLYLLPAERPGHGQPWPALDSVQADNTGRFALRGRVPNPNAYWLRAGRTGLPQLVPLANQQEQLTVRITEASGSTRQAPVYRLLLSGSPEVALLQTLAPYVALRSQAAPAADASLRRLQQLVRQQAASYLAPYLAYTYLRPQPQARPLLDSLIIRFAHEQPASSYLTRLRARLAAPRSMVAGERAPDFTLPDAQGHPLTLSTLRGRYVLLDFWASWCAPCRAANPALLAAYRRYHDHAPGFTILSVSVDEQPAAWQRAVTQDALPWPQVLDRQGLQGPTGRGYQLVGVPATYLLDPDGRIMTTAPAGPALERELARHLR